LNFNLAKTPLSFLLLKGGSKQEDRWSKHIKKTDLATGSSKAILIQAKTMPPKATRARPKVKHGKRAIAAFEKSIRY
jgi:hypothetical protein